MHRKVTGSLDTCESWAYTSCTTSSDSDDNVVKENKNQIVEVKKTGRDKVDFEYLETQGIEASPPSKKNDFEYLETQGIAASPPSKKRVLCVARQLKKSATFENTSVSFSRDMYYLSCFLFLALYRK